jgi:hypothetical protein
MRHHLPLSTFALSAVFALGACNPIVVADGTGGGTPSGSTTSTASTGTPSGSTTSTASTGAGSVPLPVCADAGSPVVVVDAPGCPCTRRPGPGQSFACPEGAGATVTMSIGVSGGTLSLLGEEGAAAGVPMELKISPLALVADTAISITETRIPPPSGFVDWSPVWRFDPIGLTFQAPVAMLMPDSNSGGDVPNVLSVYWSADGCTFTRLDDSYDNAGFMNASTTSLGYGFAGYPKSPEQATCP